MMKKSKKRQWLIATLFYMLASHQVAVASRIPAVYRHILKSVQRPQPSYISSHLPKSKLSFISSQYATIVYPIQHPLSHLQEKSYHQHRRYVGWTSLPWVFLCGSTWLAWAHNTTAQAEAEDDSGVPHLNAIHMAAIRGDVAFVESLFKYDPQQAIQLTNEVVRNKASKWDGFNALHIAAKRGHTAIVEVLIQYYPLLATQRIKDNNKIWRGCNALHIAAKRGHTAIVEILSKNQPLLVKKVVKNKYWDNGFNALQFAAYKGYTDVVKVLVEHHPELITQKIKDNNHDWNGDNALSIAVKREHESVIKVLMEATYPNMFSK